MVDEGLPAQMPNHYEVLGLSEAANIAHEVFARDLKTAYRVSLLKHHPDKVGLSNANARIDTPCETGTASYSVDQIMHAFAVLSVPELRAQYDQDLLLLGSSKISKQERSESFRTGVEIVDLDDMAFDENDNLWYRSCRCGDRRGFVITEADLEAVAGDGEVDVGCKGCSLWMKVLFQAVEDDIELSPNADRVGGG